LFLPLPCIPTFSCNFNLDIISSVSNAMTNFVEKEVLAVLVNSTRQERVQNRGYRQCLDVVRGRSVECIGCGSAVGLERRLIRYLLFQK